MKRSARIQVIAHRADVDKFDACVRHRRQATAHKVFAGAPGVDLGVLARDAAKGHEQLCMLPQHVPACMLDDQFVHRGHDVRHQHARRPKAVGIRMANVTAQAVQKPVYLALCVVKAPCAAPAVGAAKYGTIAVPVDGRAQRTRGQVQRGVPVDLDERLQPAQLGRRTHAVLKATPSNRRAHDAQATHGVQHGKSDFRGVGIAVERDETRCIRGPDNLINTPVRGCIAPQRSPPF